MKRKYESDIAQIKKDYEEQKDLVTECDSRLQQVTTERDQLSQRLSHLEKQNLEICADNEALVRDLKGKSVHRSHSISFSGCGTQPLTTDNGKCPAIALTPAVISSLAKTPFILSIDVSGLLVNTWHGRTDWANNWIIVPRFIY